MKIILATLTALVALTGVTAPADAAPARRVELARVVLKILPGHGNVFHAGDPIRICVGVETEWTTHAPARLSVDEKVDRPGASWAAVVVFELPPNTVRCFLTTERGRVDSKLRTRVHRTKHYPAAASRSVHINMA